MPSERCFFLFWLIQKKRPVQDLCHQTLLVFSLLFCFCFTHWFLYLFHCFLFIICCLYMVSLTSVFCLQFQIRKYIAYQFIYITFLLPGQSAFQQIFAPFGNSILFFWPKFPTSRRFTKKYLKFYLKTALLCGHREAQQVLSCINQGKTFKMTNWK